MKVLMFGWEFPPIASGGLGTACHGLTKGLKNKSVDVTFVMPQVPKHIPTPHVDLVSAYDVSITLNGEKITGMEHLCEVIPIDAMITAYTTSEEYAQKILSYELKVKEGASITFGRSDSTKAIYGSDLFHEVWRYRKKARLIALGKDFDIIHCHDWMTYGAGIEAKSVTGKPLVVHVHATEFDRTGSNPNQYVYDLEREGFTQADKLICVSQYTKNVVIDKYGIDPNKIEVVHNAVEHPVHDSPITPQKLTINADEKIVLFLGRVTIQKGPDWFIYTAKKVLDYYPKVKFVVAGTGDMLPFVIHKVAEMGMSDKFLFTGFLTGKDIDRAYKMADLYVMPSISEPFGITPLEAMRNGTPVLMSKQSGVSEVVTHCLKADFWDVDDMANKIIGVLEHSSLKQEIMSNGYHEVKQFNWDVPAEKCKTIYEQVLAEKNIYSSGFSNQFSSNNPSSPSSFNSDSSSKLAMSSAAVQTIISELGDSNLLQRGG